jgi:hypothetical protein
MDDMSREAWMANAEYAVRTACYPRQRVSDRAADYLDDPHEMAMILREIRTEMTRAIRALEAGTAGAFEIERLGRNLRDCGKWLAEAEQRRNEAADRAVEEAVAAERVRRSTDEAWNAELKRRADLERYRSQPREAFIHRV